MEGGRGGAKPLFEGSQRRGDTPSSPLFSRGRTGWMGRHVTRGIRGWTSAGLTLSAGGLSRWQTSPDDVLLMIAHEYCLATVEDRALDGWWTDNTEMRQLPRCPKRKQIINVKGF